MAKPKALTKPAIAKRLFVEVTHPLITASALKALKLLQEKESSQLKVIKGPDGR
jgi:hypothetical protein